MIPLHASSTREISSSGTTERRAIERHVDLSPSALERLRAHASACGTKLDVALLACAFALLGRYGGDDTAVIAIDLGRIARVSFSGAPDASELLGRVAEAVACGGERATEAPLVSFRFDGGVGDSGASACAPAADLQLVVRPSEGESGTDMQRSLRATLVFAEARFDGDCADRIASHWQSVVEAMTLRSGPVSAIPIVGAAERERILACSGVSRVRLDEPRESFVALFEAHAARTPDAVAIVDGADVLTYRELDHRANLLADRVTATGAGPGALVAVYLERGALAVTAFLGILKARATYVPIDVSYPAGRVAAILDSADPVALVTRRAHDGHLPARARTSEAHCTIFADVTGGSDDVTVTRTAPQLDDPAYAIFTSGSTGQPKGVLVDHRSLANYARAALEAYDVRANDRVLQAASLGFDLSLEEIVVTLAAGAALVVRSASPIESIQSFLGECVERGVSVLSTTSALWHELTMCLDAGSVSLPSAFRLVILGADVARPDVLAVWQRATAGRVRLVNSYGLTETTIVATVWEASCEPLTGDWRAVPIGRPLRNVSSYVIDAAGELAPIGVAGEICIGGLAVACRYIGDEALTAARFVSDPFLPGSRMYRTGDRGILRASGELEFLGRSDYQLKVRGVRVELGEIESRLREAAGVVEAVVVAGTNGAGETELEAFVMASGDVTPETLRAHLVQVLPSATVPSHIRVVERFPLTPAGKLDRRALAAMATEERRRDDSALVAPATALEELVAATVAEVLGLARVGMLDAFALLGGTSLSAVRAASILGHRTGRRVRATLFFEAQTLRAACMELASQRAASDAGDASDAGGAGGAGGAPRPSALASDAQLDPAIVARGAPSRPAALETVLLTGATGFYGTFVLADLLRETRAHVICLVRAGSATAAFERVSSALAARSCAVDPAVLTARVSVVIGDLGEPRFGLDEATFASLSEEVDAIFHLGARVNMVLPYEALRAMNVLAVHTVLELATMGRTKSVHHVSTVEVLSDTDAREPHALRERAVAASPELLQDGYGQSKWVAEKLVEEARARGVRAFIHRPGRLMGHSQTGAFNPDDLLVRLLEACGQVGAAPILDTEVDFTPVDYASRALVRFAQLEPTAPAAFHLVSPHAPTWSALVSQINDLGYPLRRLPHAEWCALLVRRAAEGDGNPFLLYLAEMSREETAASIHGGHESVVTCEALGGSVVCPPVDERLLDTCMGRLAREGRFPHPRARLRESAPPERRPSRRPSMLPGLASVLVCVMAFFAWTPSARAQPAAPPDSPASEPEPAPASAPVGVSATLASSWVMRSAAHESTLLMVASGSYAWNDWLSSFVRIGWGHDATRGEQEATVVANPTAGFTGQLHVGERLTLSASAGGSAPIGSGGGNAASPSSVKAWMSAFDWVGPMFAVDHGDIFGGFVAAYAYKGATFQLESTMHELLRVRGELADPIGPAATLSGSQATVSYALLPHLTLSTALYETRFWNTPKCIQESPDSRVDYYGIAGIATDVKVGSVAFAPSLVYARALDLPLSRQKFQVVELDVGLSF